MRILGSCSVDASITRLTVLRNANGPRVVLQCPVLVPIRPRSSGRHAARGRFGQNISDLVRSLHGCCMVGRGELLSVPTRAAPRESLRPVVRPLSGLKSSPAHVRRRQRGCGVSSRVAWVVRATNSTPASIRVAMKATLREPVQFGNDGRALCFRQAAIAFSSRDGRCASPSQPRCARR